MVVGACASLRHGTNEKSLAMFSDVVTCLLFALNSIIILVLETTVYVCVCVFLITGRERVGERARGELSCTHVTVACVICLPEI